MLKFVLLVAFAVAGTRGQTDPAASSDACTQYVRQCTQAFADSTRDTQAWIGARTCMESAPCQDETQRESLKWINEQIAKVQGGATFSSCDTAVHQCHLDFALAESYTMDVWERYESCLNQINSGQFASSASGCEYQIDMKYWVNEEIRKATTTEMNDEGCVRDVASCRDTFYSTTQGIDEWKQFNVCVVAVRPRCQEQSNMIWWVNNEIRKALSPGGLSDCDRTTNECVKSFYMTSQTLNDWNQLLSCVQAVDPPCTGQAATEDWIRKQISAATGSGWPAGTVPGRPDTCDQYVKDCTRTFADSPRALGDWYTARTCMQNAPCDSETKYKSVEWLNEEISKAEAGNTFSACDTSVQQCHINFVLSDMNALSSWERYEMCLNAITMGCQSMVDTRYWLNEEIRKVTVGSINDPGCMRQVNGCRNNFYMTQQEMGDWKAFNMCVTAIRPRCQEQSNMIWWVTNEIRKAQSPGGLTMCDQKTNTCVREFYAGAQTLQRWRGLESCVDNINPPCSEQAATLDWIRQQINAAEGEGNKPCEDKVNQCANAFYMTSQGMVNWKDYEACVEMVMPSCRFRDQTLQNIKEAIMGAEGTGGWEDPFQMSAAPAFSQSLIVLTLSVLLAWLWA